MKFISIAILLCASVSAGAQSFFIGPKAGMMLSVGTSDEVSSAGAPSRYYFGVDAMSPLSDRLDLRFGAVYRLENGGFNTDYVESTGLVGGGKTPVIAVDDPNATPPQVRSTVETSSIEITAGLHFPIIRLDSSGTRLTIGLGVLADYFVSGKQTDDYSNVPNYTGTTPIAFNYEPHIGFGAFIGAGLFLPVGSNALSLDVGYYFRDPSEITTQTTPPVDQNLGWLVGKGLRFGVSFLFGV